MSTRITLRDACERIDYGLTTSAVHGGGKGPYFLRITDIDNSFVDWGAVPRCEATPAEVAKYELKNGDVVVARTGASTGRSQWVEVAGPAVFASYLVRFRAARAFDSRFIGFVLSSAPWRDYVSAVAHGKSAQPNMSAGDMANFAFDCPELEQQRAIAEVLGALDDKIAANQRVLSCALELASAMWRKCASNASESKPLRDVATLHYGKALPAGSREPGPVDVYGSGGVVGSHTQALVSGPGVVVGRKGTAGAVHWADGPHYPIDTTYWVEGKGSVGAHYLFFALQQAGLTEMNSDSAVPGLNREEAYARPIPVPQSVDHDVFVGKCSALFDLVAQMKRESAALARSRDSLLPLLMSGKVQVKDAEKVVEGVV
jgi:type I restriction enzyme S subunit